MPQLESESNITGNAGVAARYRQYQKLIEPGEPFGFGSTLLKWYELHREDRKISDRLRREARTFLTHQIGSGQLMIPGELGFAIHEVFALGSMLMVATWRNNNELWESLFIHRPSGYELYLEDRHHHTHCVWELQAVWHESQAWSRFLRSERSAEDRATYLTDQISGLI